MNVPNEQDFETARRVLQWIISDLEEKKPYATISIEHLRQSLAIIEYYEKNNDLENNNNPSRQERKKEYKDEVISQLITVQQFCKKYPWPTESGLRWLICNAKENGFSKCVIRIGRRILIDEVIFFQWAKEHRQNY